MDMMEIRRRVLMNMASGKIPQNMAVTEIEIAGRSSNYTIAHGLGVAPDVFFLIPVSAPDGEGASNPYAYCAYSLPGSNTAIESYTVVNQYKTNSNWNYTRSGLGWTADSDNIYLNSKNSYAYKERKYILVAYKYQ